MAIDHGTRRVGVAVSDTLHLTAQPHATLDARDPGLLSAIASMISELEIETIVVGLPVGLDGTEGNPAHNARKFAGKLAKSTGVRIEFQDERFTSKIAEQAMLEADLSRQARKEASDRVAASLILRDYLARAK